MDLGYVSHEELRAWATYNAIEVLVPSFPGKAAKFPLGKRQHLHLIAC